MFYLTLEHVHAIIDELSKRQGESIAIINKGQLEFALEKPHMMVFGTDPYPELYQKIAILMESINKGHTLSDGNKRTAIMAAEYMANENDARLVLPFKAIRFSVEVAKDKDDLMREIIQKWFKTHLATDRFQLCAMLQENIEEEAIIKSLLRENKYDDAEKIIDRWLSFDAYPAKKDEWKKYVEDWKKVSNADTKSEKNVFGTDLSRKWKTIMDIAKFEEHQFYDGEKDVEPKTIRELKYQEFTSEELCNHEDRIKLEAEKMRNASKNIYELY